MANNVVLNRGTLTVLIDTGGWGVPVSSRSPHDKGEVRDVFLAALNQLGKVGAVGPTEQADAALARLAREVFGAATTAGVTMMALDN